MRVQDQSETMRFLADPASYGAAGPVDTVETHISAVFLAGDRAYKLKKAVHLPYVDFSTPAIRVAACETELALNQPVTPELYLGVRRITRAPGGLAFDGPGDLVDAVVEMERFDQDDLLDQVAARGELTAAMVRGLAGEIARAHDKAPVAGDEGGAANIAGVLDINRAGFGQSRVFDAGEVDAIDGAFRAELARLAALLDARARDGCLRRCHGDLHLRNICLFRGRPRLFDCLDFNDRLATIDVLYDLAFLAMDLWHRGLPDLASLLVNDYLDTTGQEDGFALLPFFMALRAEVRAHVIATQVEGRAPADAEERRATARSYYDLALEILHRRPARLVVVGGLSGSGKSTLAAALAPGLGAPPGARLIESDRARKAMFGVTPGTRLPEDAYRPEVSDRIYATLASRSRALLEAGCTVVADAVYDRLERRAEIEAAAVEASVPFNGIWLDAAADVLMRRVAGRHGDVSDATTEVLRAQLKRDPGRIEWNHLSAEGSPAEILAAARDLLGGNGVEIHIRYAGRDDVDALVALEALAFETDRLSRRSFRDFIDATTARLRVAMVDGHLAGYALTTWRRGTGVARLYSIATAPALRGTGVAARLLADAEEGACQLERAVMRLEVGTENAPALTLYRRAGYHVVERLPGYYEDGTDALRLEKPLRGAAAPDTALDYYQQTTEFTCGAACLMMTLRAGDPAFPFDPVTEVRLWREATTIFMTSGLGGCEPYGMATVLAEHGQPVTIWTTIEGPLLLRTVQNAEKRRVMTLAQADFQNRIRAMDVPVRVELLGVEELVAMLEAGAVAILLISGSRMFGKKVPHWVLAFAADEAHVFLHDPWVEHEAFETPTDAAAIPVPFTEVDRMWRWGADRLRAAVIAWPGKMEQSGR